MRCRPPDRKAASSYSLRTSSFAFASPFGALSRGAQITSFRRLMDELYGAASQTTSYKTTDLCRTPQPLFAERRGKFVLGGRGEKSCFPRRRKCGVERQLARRSAACGGLKRFERGIGRTRAGLRYLFLLFSQVGPARAATHHLIGALDAW